MHRAAVRKLVAAALGPALLLATIMPPSISAYGLTERPRAPEGRQDPLQQADGTADVNLAGLWDFGDGLMVQIEQSGTSITSSVVKHDCSGAEPSEYLTATIDGDSLAGTMHRCTRDDDLVVTDFGCEQLWDTPFQAEATRHEISGTYTGQYIVDVGCKVDYLYEADFSGTRVDCRPLTFEELAEENPDGADELQLAQEFEGGKTLHWSDEQVSNGFKERAEAFTLGLGRSLGGIYGPGTINSAYRPLLYQAHFANLRECGLRLIQALRDWTHEPDIVEALADSVNALKAEVQKHGIKSEVTTVAGQSVPVPFVCWRDPLAACPHVDGKAIDVSFRQVDGLDWEAAIRGWCRRYLPVDPPHWEEISEGRCGAEYLPGRADIDLYVESPVAIMVTDASGQRMGYDAASGSVVNDYGDSAFYTGPETEPQRLFVPAAAGAGDEIEIALTAIGDGPYTVRLSFLTDDGIDAREVRFEGVAQRGRAIPPVRQAFMPASGEPMFPEAAPIPAEAGWEASYAAPTPTGLANVVSLNPAIADAVLVNEQLGAVGIRVAEGPERQIAVRVAPALRAPLRVRIEGQEVPAAVEQGADATIVRFSVPAGATVVEIREQDSATPVGGVSPVVLGMMVMLLLVAVAAGAFLLWRRRGRSPAAG